jgi:hypothetical protein
MSKDRAAYDLRLHELTGYRSNVIPVTNVQGSYAHCAPTLPAHEKQITLDCDVIFLIEQYEAEHNKANPTGIINKKAEIFKDLIFHAILAKVKEAP